jgi:hypothetical protein
MALAGFLGCQKVNPVREPEPPVVKMVEDVELAKLILRPESGKLDVSRDPFKPLNYTQQSGPAARQTDDLIKQVELLGVTRVNNEFRALLKTASERRVCQINDVVAGYVIEDIMDDRIILNDGARTITLKRGGQK